MQSCKAVNFLLVEKQKANKKGLFIFLFATRKTLRQKKGWKNSIFFGFQMLDIERHFAKGNVQR